MVISIVLLAKGKKMTKYYEITDGDIHVGYVSEEYVLKKCEEKILTGKAICNILIGEDEAINVEPVKHGHWEWDDELGANICSECGRPTYDSHDEYVEFMGSKVLALVSPYYCGYCGARMDEVTE